MQFAVNYSPKLAQLVKNEQVQIDYFKCPAWDTVIDQARALLPTYIHFPLAVGSCTGQVIDTERQAPVDWTEIERLLAKTQTAYVNLHLIPRQAAYPHLPVNTSDPIHIEQIEDNCLQAIASAVKRFGAEKVILENDHASHGSTLRVAYSPRFIRTMIEESGCGFLLDVSHARFAAQDLHMDINTYLGKLPTHAIREIHLTGIQRMTGKWLAMAQNFGVNETLLARYAEQIMDHLPMTEADFTFFETCLDAIAAGEWQAPWAVGYEYGGVSGFWEGVTDEASYLADLPRLNAMLKERQTDFS